ncbi:hypothetical protein [Spirosoma sp. KUDC1026]|uniref:hypothetical protein n=1 Tax=Spirosoma sp. KUDC1026 TaxID=2745947 RepID=UPI00159BD995|nr:hypothetical protein [Spirosoma sp. KUDC1026]QKZ11568.1 hypothetical protein HU175_02555 [Spirosoma sp. KUDC1026]
MLYRLFVLCLLLKTTTGLGQTSADTLAMAAGQIEAVLAYDRATKKQAHLFEGNEYVAHNYQIKIHPFFFSDSLQIGTVDYNGVFYKNVSMLYDIVRDELAIQRPGTPYRIRLHSEQIRSFSIGSHHFARLVGDSTVEVRTGFYQLLYDGSVKALARRVKTIHEDISSGQYKADFVEEDRYFILKNGTYYPVKSKRALLRLFPEQASVLQKYLRANGIKFKQQREEAITAIVRQYDHLTH